MDNFSVEMYVSMHIHFSNIDQFVYIETDINLYFIIVTDFSLTQWKAENGLVSLSEGDSHLLQEELRISQYLWTYGCSRESDDFIHHTNYWKDGNYLILKTN